MKCFHYGHTDHCIINCKAKIVFSSEEAENKDIKEYLNVRKEDKGGSSESGDMLREEKQKSSYSNDSLHSLESILLPASKLKPILKHKNQDKRENSD
jgi:hypothetical protein